MIEPSEEMIKAAARAISQNWKRMHTNESLGRESMLAEAALTAAIPLIAARVAGEIAERINDEVTMIPEDSHTDYRRGQRDGFRLSSDIARSYTEGQN